MLGLSRRKSGSKIRKQSACASKEDRVKALQSYKDGSNNAFGMGKVMQLHAKNLSDEDMAAVSEYIEGLK